MDQHAWFPQQAPSFKNVGLETSRKIFEESAKTLMKRVPSIGGPHRRQFFIHQDNKEILQWVSPKKTYNKSRVKLRDIERIYFACFYSKKLQKHKKRLEKKEHLCISIVFDQGKVLDLVALDGDTFKFWLTGIQLFINDCYSNPKSLVSARLQYYQNIWAEVDLDMNKRLDLNEIKLLLNKLNISVKEDYLFQFVQKYDKDRSCALEFEEFYTMMDDIHFRKELLPVFKTYMNQTQPIMHTKELYEFLLECQGQSIPYDECDKIIKDVINEDKILEAAQKKEKPGSEKAMVSRGLDFMSFSQFLLTEEFNDCFDPKKKEIYQDMTQPLSQYYCYSSHNTYLTGHQLKGESSIEMYKESLLNGCRCIEIDCWDGPNNEPKVTHGYTLTSAITFRSVIEAVEECAFQYSQYPVIISLEMHCSQKQQEVIANHMIDVLGELNIYKLPNYITSITQAEDIPRYPSPEELKRKYVIKCKAKRILPQVEFQEKDLIGNINYQRGKTRLLTDEDKQTQNSIPDFDVPFLSKQIYSAQVKQIREPKRHNISKSSIIDQNSDEENEGEMEEYYQKIDEALPEFSEKDLKKLKQKMNQKQSAEAENKLAALTSMIGFHFKKGHPCYPWEIKSLDENKIHKGMVMYGREYWQDHHFSNFTRVYPKGVRFDSSNYSPLEGWAVGAQIVALNLQTKDEHQLINNCYFEQNGGKYCGYILKPPFLRGLLPESNLPTKTIKINLLSGFQLPKKGERKDIVDPFVTIELKTTSFKDNIKNQEMVKTKFIKNNGFNPIWSKEFKFKYIDGELNFLIFKVYDMDETGDTLLCWNAVNIECLRKGIRVITMKDNKLKKVVSKLIIHITPNDTQNNQ
ncbi:1-phosphatidylinositol-bisphosphate phosphodiesterase eta-2 [Stylonychia lemnae]|uniref:Phosphoinositide phospholipase C n=1 Tax=Stylonychia lemnae TaxID=5949 RepID=A0A078B7Y7_STYLE|nr:1-phosphatidylinositol-bisphosphate phosphodiesterase eta-2 [Stylonychia lemnae]|eukprot:CDW90514.1 1-phosphatidylinositol-bisphosphate phosphodiesterase eta-2 [Stylonychia lemnae]